MKKSCLRIMCICFTILNCVNSNSQPNIIIIGAGASGIATASKLLENAIENITILEAENRIGGRIHSVEFGDAIVDLGAQWVHGERNNVVYEMVKELNLVEPSNLKPYLVYANLDVDESFKNEMQTIVENILNEIPEEEISFGEYVTQAYNKTVLRKYGNDSQKIERAFEILVAIKNQVLTEEGAFSWFDSSARYEYKACEGVHDLNWKHRGYKTIFDILLKKFPEPNNELPFDNKIFLNKEVIEIKWNNSDAKIVVNCLDGSKYVTDHVIFTPSLGVLKAQHRALFHPNLPTNKINAIEELGIAAANKVFLHFKQNFWPNNFPNDIYLCWTKEELANLTQEFPYGPVQDGRSWLESFTEIVLADYNPNVLVAWFTGELLPLAEYVPDDILVDGIMFVINKFFGKKFSIVQPNEILYSSWYKNPHFLGTYSFETLASRKRNISGQTALSEPIVLNGKPILLFAGEATSPLHYSTVHAAVETGFREADRIIDFYKQDIN